MHLYDCTKQYLSQGHGKRFHGRRVSQQVTIAISHEGRNVKDFSFASRSIVKRNRGKVLVLRPRNKRNEESKKWTSYWEPFARNGISSSVSNGARHGAAIIGVAFTILIIIVIWQLPMLTTVALNGSIRHNPFQHLRLSIQMKLCNSISGRKRSRYCFVSWYKYSIIRYGK